MARKVERLECVEEPAGLIVRLRSPDGRQCLTLVVTQMLWHDRDQGSNRFIARESAAAELKRLLPRLCGWHAAIAAAAMEAVRFGQALVRDAIHALSGPFDENPAGRV